jgi:ABC-type polysaccharide/polyol phosphate export permease
MTATITLIRMTIEMARRDIKMRFAGSYFGVFWSIGVPLFNAVIYAFVFSFVMAKQMGPDYDEVPYVVFYFPGMTAWMFFTEVASRSATVIVDSASFITKIRFPLIILPPAMMVSALIAHGVMVAISIAIVIFVGGGLTWHVALFPVALIFLVIFSIGIGYLIAAVTPFIRDLAQAIPIMLNALFFMTPIVYTPGVVVDAAPSWARIILMDANPLHHLIELYRWTLIGKGYDVSVETTIFVAIASLLALATGVSVYRRLQKYFVDVL